MPLDPENKLEIIVNLSVANNAFVITSDIEPVPDMTFFDHIRIFSDHLTGWVEPKSDNSHKLDLTLTSNNYSIPKYVSCGGQWGEAHYWHFEFNNSIYHDVITILDNNNISYTEGSNTTPVHVRLKS